MIWKILVSTLALFSLNCTASEEPAEIAALREKYNAAKIKTEASLNALHLNYIKQLDKLKANAQKSGDLDQLLAIEKEATALLKGESDIDAKFGELARARAMFDEAHQNIWQTVANNLETLNLVYVEQLVALQGELTREGRIEDAVFVKAYVDNIATNIPANQPKGDLIGHWTFDKDGNDSSGYGRHASLAGGAKIVEGRVGDGALKTGPGQYAEVPHHPDFNLQGPFTIAAWGLLDSGITQDKWAPIIAKTNKAWRLQVSPGSQSIGFHLNTNAGVQSVDMNSRNIDTAKWIHFAATFDGKSVTLFIDGREVDRRERNQPLEVSIQDNKAIRFGGNVSMPRLKFNGIIDDVRIYMKQLDTSDIKRLAAGSGLMGESR